ncbi:hypothetical protein KC909_06795 [Candidatus Dojkabacteria bacterium]|uniref:Uncharacterized protein n=1 Tax=Candidatus Dojkabacteria bacterium TaxID=2099670 RepID=A0A955RJK8_9BACT|nr:hypothetical protein [Candidatus Dojkabacteria bacterium]
MKQSKASNKTKSSTIKSKKQPINRNFGDKVDRNLGKYLQDTGFSSMAEILKIDK